MRVVIALIGLVVLGIIVSFLLIPQPEPSEAYDDTAERTTLTILANEYLDRQPGEIGERTGSAEHLCGPYAFFPEHVNATGSRCDALLANRSHVIVANGTRFEAGYAVFETAVNASAQLNETIFETRALLAERLIPNGEIENHNQVVRGQLGPDVDEARFLSAQLDESTYRTVSLVRANRTVYFVIEDSAEQIIERRYDDAFSSDKHARLLDIYNVSIIG